MIIWLFGGGYSRKEEKEKKKRKISSFTKSMID
jgi:hypothetical protein